MEVVKAYKFRVYPDKDQLERVAQCCGVARYAWNWTLGKCNDEWSAALEAAQEADDYTMVKDKKGNDVKRYNVKSPGVSRARLYKAFVDHHQVSAADKRAAREDHPFLWLCDIHSHVYSYPIEDVCKAFVSWWRERKKGRKFGAPRFKSKGRCRDSFRIQINARMIQGNKIRVPGIGLLRCKPNPSKVLDDARPKVVTVSRTADRWYASVAYATEQDMPRTVGDGEPSRVIGVDLGIQALITMSTGETIAPSKTLERNLRRLARLNRQLGRKEKGSRRRAKAKVRLQRLHATIAEQRADYLHKASRKLVDSADLIVVEGFDVQHLISKGADRRDTRRRMADAAWGELRRQLEYKAAWAGCEILILGKIEPTDQRCSCCGALNERVTSKYQCSECGLETTRQLNTARLLESFGRGNPPEGTGGHPGTHARGLHGSGSSSDESTQVGRNVNANPAVPPEASASGVGGFFSQEDAKGPSSTKRKRTRKTGGSLHDEGRANSADEMPLQEPRSSV